MSLNNAQVHGNSRGKECTVRYRGSCAGLSERFLKRSDGPDRPEININAGDKIII